MAAAKDVRSELEKEMVRAPIFASGFFMFFFVVCVPSPSISRVCDEVN